MILFSDLHLDEDSAEVVFSEILPGIKREAFNRRDPVIVCLGDFYSLRYQVRVEIQNAVRDELQTWVRGGLQFRLLPGNHDQVDVHGRNALEVFDQLGPNCVVYTHPQWDEFGLWVPYRKYPKDLEAAFQRERPVFHEKGKATLFGHFGVRGAAMNDHVYDADGVPREWLAEFGTVLLGHYHQRQTLGNVHYIGSPRQVTVHEAGHPKGYAIWDGLRLEYVNTRWGKRFHRVRLEEGDNLDPHGLSPGDDVRVSVAAGVNVEALGQQLTAMNVQHTVTPDIAVADHRLEVQKNAGLVEYARAYVEQLPTELDRERLMTVFGELCHADHGH